MMTPYDWQEGIGHRAQYIESRLQSGVPVAAVSIPEGVLVATYRGHARKVFEVYDRLVYSAVGLQSDVEALRVAAVDFCHQEGYARSEADVSVQRVATALSAPVKRAFADFSMAPLILRCLFAEVDDSPDKDRYYKLDYDGDYSVRRYGAVVAGSADAYDTLHQKLKDDDFTEMKLDDALANLREAVLVAMDPDGSKARDGELPELTFEAALLERGADKARRFRLLAGAVD
ncbi:MAG: hypothetical protein KF857_07785 [Fimbriimonadaceae bacterium]|nr:hypothetical protein [Fimbriimonadaceae bacterium]